MADTSAAGNVMPMGGLISEAVALGGGNLCASGHDWRTNGGRGCPRNPDNITCGQAVYQCARCHTYDYGEPGGPGHRDCFGGGKLCDPSCEVDSDA